jgi:hypothetical protein
VPVDEEIIDATEATSPLNPLPIREEFVVFT